MDLGSKIERLSADALSQKCKSDISDLQPHGSFIVLKKK